jgi:hypothetical protein
LEIFNFGQMVTVPMEFFAARTVSFGQMVTVAWSSHCSNGFTVTASIDGTL